MLITDQLCKNVEYIEKQSKTEALKGIVRYVSLNYLQYINNTVI